MEEVILRGGAYYLVAFIAFLAAVTGVDTGFSVHMWIVTAAALLAAFASNRGFDWKAGRFPAPTAATLSTYDDDPIRWGAIATLFWCMAGFLAGNLIPAAWSLEFAVPLGTGEMGAEESADGARADGHPCTRCRRSA